MHYHTIWKIKLCFSANQQTGSLPRSFLFIRLALEQSSTPSACCNASSQQLWLNASLLGLEEHALPLHRHPPNRKLAQMLCVCQASAAAELQPIQICWLQCKLSAALELELEWKEQALLRSPKPFKQEACCITRQRCKR